MIPEIARKSQEPAQDWIGAAMSLGLDPAALVWTLRRSHSDGEGEEWNLRLDGLAELEMGGNPASSWVVAVKAAVAKLLVGTDGERAIGVHSTYEAALKMISFCRWAIGRDITSAQEVKPIDVERYLREISGRIHARTGRRPTKGYIATTAWRVRLLLALQPGALSLSPLDVKRIVGRVAVDASRRRRDRTPPEDLVLRLLSEALRLIEEPAEDIIRLRDEFRRGLLSSRRRDLLVRRKAGLKQIEEAKFSCIAGESKPWTDATPGNLRQMARLLRVVQGACLFVIAFACAPRISEIRFIQRSSLVSRTSPNGGTYRCIVGRLAKSGRAHEWIVCAPVVRAIEVLSRISAPLSEAAGRDAILLGGRGATLWSSRWTKSRIYLESAAALTRRLNLFVRSSEAYTGSDWKRQITMRHGRRSFARFVTMRNKNALGDLAIHFGHMSRTITDRYYASGDSEYVKLIDQGSEDDAIAVLNEIAHATDVFSNMGSVLESETKRRIADVVERARKSVDVKRMLGAGAALAPCDWGVCMYKQDTSACRGGAMAPSDARRTPDVCVDCVNFVVPPSWLPWWKKRVSDLEAYLRLNGLPRQTRLVVSERLQKARSVVGRIQSHE